MYVDYSFCQAAKYKTLHGDELLDIQNSYDIGCKWWINFLKRVEGSPKLDWDERRRLIVAVGKWHLASHQRDCFCKFSLNFIIGAGHLDGEIMETIWSQLNDPARRARSMTLAHRLVFLEQHIRDMNFKKMVSMGK
jgi:hypothetical protein